MLEQSFEMIHVRNNSIKLEYSTDLAKVCEVLEAHHSLSEHFCPADLHLNRETENYKHLPIFLLRIFHFQHHDVQVAPHSCPVLVSRLFKAYSCHADRICKCSSEDQHST